uniref:Protein N-terminal asparagine amidohydrolase-like n=1 Tax=Salarias fasciatus TaxID=181472 RepID=A0A672HY52_SALFA
MPLFIQNREVDRIRSTAELYDRNPHLQEYARAFRSKKCVDVDPKCLLYVQQREFAATTPADNYVSVIGSEDATTCHMVVLRHTGTGAVCIAHCDGSSTSSEVPQFVKAVKSLSDACKEGRLELHLVGGFNDESKMSHNLSLNILAAFQNQEEDIHLETCCTTEMNDVLVDGIHKPIIYGIGVKVETGEVFPASFTFKGPAENLRSARTFTGGEYLSTSPMAEPPHFVQHMKSTIQFVLDHPNPDSLFPGGQPQLYRKAETGDWKRVAPS